jgi:SAM-dependent MidA family methyltransferase
MEAAPSTGALTPEWLDALRHHGPDPLRFDHFVALALYHPQLGYYAQPRVRVGYGPGTDFYTASTSGPIFGELICAACQSLLPGEDLSRYAFVEIGAEPDRRILAGVAHPFGRERAIAFHQQPEIEGRCVVFSNELFDAQPFRRLVFAEGAWHEIGVSWRSGRLTEVLLPLGADRPPGLPTSASEGYHLDVPDGARSLTARIADQPWSGLFLAFDYGKTWRELTEATPQGTARAYFRHRQSNDLLARPGEQDLTCHVCWDWLVEALAARRFSPRDVESQESFLVNHAGSAIAQMTSADAARFSPRKLSVLQLLHPGNLGQKFQVLSAVRK